MCRVVSVKSEEMFPVILELLEKQRVRITVTGSSMMPFLRDRIDTVELEKADYDMIKKGRIVLIRRDSGAYVLHRIIRKDEACFFIAGDNQDWIEGPLKPDRLLAAAAVIWRGSRRLECGKTWLDMAARVWLEAFPFRNLIKNAVRYPYRAARRILGSKNKGGNLYEAEKRFYVERDRRTMGGCSAGGKSR